MKKLVAISFILLLSIGCKARKSGPAIVMIDMPEVNATAKNRAYELGKRVLNSCNTSRFTPFTNEEATAQLIKNITPEKITKTCQKFRIKYGKFKDIELSQVLKNKADNSLIFRYKAQYQWKHTLKELRVVVNEEGKVSAIKSTNWVDLYQP
ncbi:MAG: hypothetical protein CFE23_05665 [Flavobacterium sp. BFFFF1]|uniref:hypothetical protein n=1 Tax=unclassified Flavobacterium TaxID=196869 RepID=UPI000BCE7A7D|nr:MULTISPECIES: hypothetical protein [unclassified Flavobacterium]OYU81251.1 MAG: hypothetical protein CFE23_05665 [Flavobacterium sp. BFFFF1]